MWSPEISKLGGPGLMRKILSVLLALAVILSLLPAAAVDSPAYSDVSGHWAQPAIEKWSGLGILKGSDGKFRPDEAITRGEMAVIIDRIMLYRTKAQNTFTDLGQAFYTDSILKANAAGVILGSNGLARPTDTITREEAAVMLSRALGLSESSSGNGFADSSSVSSWALGFVNAMSAKGFIHGSDGRFNPKTSITRAETVTILDNAIKKIDSEAAEYTGDTEGTIIVNTSGAVLSNMKITGDLIISEGVGDGEVTLNNVTVTGNTVVRGGGTNSFTIKGNSSLANLIVTRIDGAVSIKVLDSADVEVVYVADGSDDVNIEGTVGSIEVAAAGITVNAVGADISSIGITGENSKVIIDADSSVKEVNIKQEADNSKVVVNGSVTTITTSGAGTTISGTGTVKTVDVQTGASNTSIATPSTKIIVDSGVTGVTGGGGTAISGGTTAANNSSGTDLVTSIGGSSGGGGDTPSVSITSINVESATSVTVVSSLSGLSFKLGSVSLTSVQSGTGPYSYSITVPAANALEIGTNTITVMKSGYNNKSVEAYYPIQLAINAATAGDTLTIKAGTYKENLTINKALTITGVGSATTILDGNSSGVVVTILASNVTFDGFTVKNSGSDIATCAGIGIVGATASVTGVTMKTAP